MNSKTTFGRRTASVSLKSLALALSAALLAVGLTVSGEACPNVNMVWTKTMTIPSYAYGVRLFVTHGNNNGCAGPWNVFPAGTSTWVSANNWHVNIPATPGSTITAGFGWISNYGTPAVTVRYLDINMNVIPSRWGNLIIAPIEDPLGFGHGAHARGTVGPQVLEELGYAIIDSPMSIEQMRDGGHGLTFEPVPGGDHLVVNPDEEIFLPFPTSPGPGQTIVTRHKITTFDNGEVQTFIDYTQTMSPLPGDVDNNGTVDDVDLAIVLELFGTADEYGDLDDDGVVTDVDLAIVLENFGRSR